MESLRRLTSSVFDSNSRLGGVVRRNSGSSSSNNAPVYGDDDARALGMTFITERLIVTGYPVHTPTNKKTNEINVDELAQYLETHHSNHYLAFNLNSLEEAAEANGGACPSPADRHHPSLMDQLLRKTPSPSSYANHNAGSTSADAARAIAEKVREQMLEFSWERDGMKAHTPPFDLIFRICYSIFAWLSLDSQNVALVHCLSGKTRSGVIVACYLLFARLADDPIDAFVEFYKKRWEMYALTPQALRSKTPPSIQRFLASFHELIEYQKPPHDKPMLLKAIIFRALPVELQPCVQIWDDYKMIFCTDSLPASMDAKDAPVLDWNGDDGFFAILWENGIDLDGGFSILCSFGDEYGNDDEVDASSRVLFRYADSTWFLNPGLVTLTKHKLDMMKQYEHGFDEDLFSVDLVLHDSAKPRKNYVRLDYTGNNAVRQGLIEITKHHLVLPDPAMHSNFIRMGFGETPTTFALQRSQNTPNVALDLLHSEGLAACFASETPARSAQDEEIAASEGSSMPTVGVESMKTASAAPLRRQTTAEIVAMQSQRSKYSIPTAADVFVCHTCNDDDYMMRPQIVRCTGRCGHFYHTTCVGLRKIPFGLTTMSDRTNHGVYMKKFFSAWECDACAPPPAEAATKSKTAVEVPPDMTLVPSSWVNSYVPSAATGDHEKTNGPTQSRDLDSSNQTASESIAAAASITSAKYEMMLKRGVPFEAVQNYVEEFKSYFNMLRLGCPKDAVKQKLIMDGLDPSIIDFGPDANYDEVKDKIAHVLPIEERSRLQDDIKNVREPKRQGAREADKQPFTSAKVSEEPSASTEESRSTKPDDVPLRDHEIYSKYFKMLKMGLPEDAVRHKIKSDGADERALELGGDAPFSKLAETAAVATLGEDPVYAKYFKMLKMGLPEGAVRHKMVQDEVDPKALELGPDAPVTGLTKASGAPSASKQAQGLKPKPRRKKLHWQAISEDRLSSIGQQTIWEDKDEDAVEFDMDMDELESLFFANNDANSTGSSSKKKPGHGAAQPLKRKQSVTLIDGKRAMNAAISLARVKLSYSEIADAAEKFILEISKVERYATRMECLVFKLAFAPRSAELAASYTNMIKASEEVKGSRLLKILLSMVLKLGNTLNGSGDDNGIRGFTVDSLLRLGHTKAVNQKTTVLHYLVRLVKKNHPQVLDFQQELQCVPLAARESFDTIGEDFAKLQAGFARMTTELEFLQKQASNDAQAVATAKSMQDAVSAIGAQMQKLEQEIQRAREEVASVFDYFGEDPNRNPTDFFTTLTSFCTEVDAADEASLRAERLKLRRSGSVARPPAKGGSKEAGGVVASAFQLRLRERAQSGDLATRHSTTNM
uniref:Formin-like protein n=1 Tax=Globisporangium ultimum (strain ATCC 200006 / CBS 805.95 / DAOM BR144) TaxID=431595 RepID=K3WVX6_GLOUD